MLLPSFIGSQTVNIDSLIQLSKTMEDDTSKVNLLNQISWEYHRSDPEKNLTYGKKAIELANKLSYQKGKGRAMNLMAIAYATKGKNKQSINLNEACLAIGKEHNISYLVNISSNDLGVTYSDLGEHEKALLYYQTALDISIADNDILGIAFSYQNIGMVHFELGNTDEAISYLNQGIEAGEKSNDQLVLSSLYNSKAIIDLNNEDFINAEINFNKAFEISKKLNDWVSMSSIMIEKAYINLEKGNNELAVENLKDGLALAQQSKYVSFITNTYINISDIYLQLEDLDNAKDNAFMALELATKDNQIQEQSYLFSILSDIFQEEEDFKSALEYRDKYYTLSDSLFSLEKSNSTIEIEAKYKSENKEKENQFLLLIQEEQKSLIKNQRLFNYLLGSSLIIFFILGLLIIRLYRSKISSHKLLEEKVKERTTELSLSNEKLKNSNIELERFAYITSHDLKEPLRNITSFVKLLERSLGEKMDDRQKDYMTFIAKNTHQMHQLIEDVLEYSKLSNHKETRKAVDLNETIKNIEYSISNTLSNNHSQIKINTELPIIESHPTRMHLLFKNLIENGLKYNESLQPEINIKYSSDSNKHIFSVIDNGIGIEKEYFPQVFEMFKRLHNRETYEGTGLGLSLTQKIVNSLGGEIWLESEVGKGSTFHFTIPKNIHLN